MRKVKALSRLAGGNPHGCNVGIFLSDEAVARAAALFVSLRFQIGTSSVNDRRGGFGYD